MDSRSNEAPKHTPGKWFADHWDGDKSKDIAIQSDRLDGVTLIGEVDSDKIADAKLIAAAPEMLEALKAVRLAFDLLIHDKLWNLRFSMNDINAMVTAAIAKAEGRTP